MVSPPSFRIGRRLRPCLTHLLAASEERPHDCVNETVDRTLAEANPDHHVNGRHRQADQPHKEAGFLFARRVTQVARDGNFK